MVHSTTPSDKYRKERDIAILLAKQASQNIIRPFYYGGAAKDLKDDGSPVTEADIKTNRFLVEGIKQAFAQDGIISEELEDITGKRVWYIDPIDGTKGFVGHSDQFAIHIGLAEEGKPVFGLIYKPTTDEFYTGTQGLGAWRVHPDGTSRQLYTLKLFDQENLDIIVNTTFMRRQRELMDALNPRRVLVSGGLGLRAMRVAEKEADVYVQARRNLCGTWDTCAPQAIIEAAGGSVMYEDGSAMTYHGQRGVEKRFVMARSEELARKVVDVMVEYGV